MQLVTEPSKLCYDSLNHTDPHTNRMPNEEPIYAPYKLSKQAESADSYETVQATGQL
jgi:hypothetical protein